MTTDSGDRDAVDAAPGGLSRRQLLVTGLGTAVGGAAVLIARPAGAASPGLALPAGTEGVSSARSDVVGDWYEQVVTTTAPFSPPVGSPGVGDRMWAVSWASAAAALDGGGRGWPARLPQFQQAAVATAVHHALVGQAPAAAGSLDAALASSLAAIRDGDAKQAGIRAGRDAAARILGEREGDGLDATSVDVPFALPPEAPGVFRLPPGETRTVGAGLCLARPFLLDRADQFRPGPPPALGTERYRRDLGEVQRFGGVVSERDERQSVVAWLAPGMQYVPALRSLVQGRGRSLLWKVRLLAAYSIAVVDALIASSDTKFTYLHWRPITAIRAADTDGDPLTDPDPTWESYLWTPPHPDYPSAHAVIAGAVEQVLERFTGLRTPVPVNAVVPRADGTVANLDYPRGTRWSTLTDDNIDARVWAGVHFRFSDEVGTDIGRDVGDHTLRLLEGR